jgi:Zn-dependent protease with chaperone function
MDTAVNTAMNTAMSPFNGMSLHGAMLLPWLAAAALAVGSRRAAGVLAPSVAVPLLAVASLLTAAASGFVLSVLAFTFIAQDGEVAAIGHWSVPVLRAADPVLPALGMAAAVAVGVLFAAAVLAVARSVRDLIAADLACRRLGAGAHGLVIVSDPLPEAYALPGITGRVVVSTAMLRALPPGERRAVLAHEASHLRHRHHLYTFAADIAAAANPLLRPAAAAVRAGVERWADEDAARDLGDRRLVARAVARAARATARAGASHRRVVMEISGGVASMRARALLAPPPRPRRWVAACLLALMAATAVSTAVVEHGTEVRFDQAQAAWTQPGR